MCALCASTHTHTPSRSISFLECVMHAWHIKLGKKAWAWANVSYGRVRAPVLRECVTTFKMNTMRVVVQDNSFISFYLIFSRSQFYRLEKFAHVFSMMAVVVFVFSHFSFSLDSGGGFLNPSQFQSQRVYEIWVQLWWCALCNVHASILHTQFNNFDFIPKILSFGGVMDSHPDGVFPLISRCSRTKCILLM